jgi:hypothetical protein
MSLYVTYLCTKLQHCFLLSCSLRGYDLQSVSGVCSKELGPSFHTLFLTMFASKLRIHFSLHSRLHQGCLFLGTTCKQEGVGVLCQRALSNLEKGFFFLPHTKDISQDMRLLFFLEALYHRLESNECKDP